MNGNTLFFQKLKEGISSNEFIDEASRYFTLEEMIFLTKLYRYGFDYAMNIVQQKYPIPKTVKMESINAGGVPAEWQIAPGAVKDRVLLYLHGGGLIMGSTSSYRGFTTTLGQLTKMRVLSLNYRLAPEYPYPAQIEDCIGAYQWLLSTGIKPNKIVIAGDSGGGYLTLSTLIKLRNDGIPLPIGAVCFSPGTDYASTSGTIVENAQTDPIIADIGLYWWIPAYLQGADPIDPAVSPIYADLEGLPPLLLQASTCEMLFDQSKNFVDKAGAAGVNATLQTWGDMVHVFQMFGLHDLPEAKEALDNVATFVQTLFE